MRILQYFILKNKNLTISITGVFVLLSLVLPIQYQDIISLVIVLTAGVIHGANDLHLMQHPSLRKTGSSFSKSLILYVFFVFVVFGSFYFLPSLALVSFVFLSAYHFGEQHWSSIFQKSTTIVRCFYFVYGCLLFALLFYFNSDEVINVVSDLTGYTITPHLFLYSLMLVAFLQAIFTVWLFHHIRLEAIRQLLILLLLGIVFFYGTLLLAFAVYFVFWHSIPSIKEQTQFLFGNSRNNELLQYVKKALLYWILALLALAALFVLLSDQKQQLLSIFFCFLAAITFPHTFVIVKMKDTMP